MHLNELVLVLLKSEFAVSDPLFPSSSAAFPTSSAAAALLCAAANSLRQLTAAKRMMGEDAALACTALDDMDWDAGGIIEEGRGC